MSLQYCIAFQVNTLSVCLIKGCNHKEPAYYNYAGIINHNANNLLPNFKKPT